MGFQLVLVEGMVHLEVQQRFQDQEYLQQLARRVEEQVVHLHWLE
jgi:hypothetical protein